MFLCSNTNTVGDDNFSSGLKTLFPALCYQLRKRVHTRSQLHPPPLSATGHLDKSRAEYRGLFRIINVPPATPSRQYHQHNKIQSTFFMLIKLSVHGRSIYIRIFPWSFSLLVRPRRRVSSRCPRRDAPLMDWYKSSVFPLKGSRSVQNVLKDLSESCLKPWGFLSCR